MENSNFSGVIKILLFFFICTLFTINSVSQELPIISYGTREGLPSVFINSLTQDNYGRIWVSHHTGISVYNGSRFQSWSREDGLLASAPNMIVSDKKGSIWISFSSRGIQYMEMDGTIHTVPDPYEVFSKDRIPFLYRMNDKTILGAGKKGFYRISKKRIQGPFYPEDGKEGRVIYILDLGKKKGKLISTEDGVYRVQGNSVSRFPLPYEKIGSQIISLMTEGNKGELWFVSSTGWLIRREKGQFKLWDLRKFFINLPTAFFEMKMDFKGRLWIASGGGLLCWNEGTTSQFTENHGLSNIWINHLIVDREGILWIATESGLDKIANFGFRNYRYRKDLPVNAVWAMEELPDGSIWIGTNSGIVDVDLDGNTRIISKEQGLPEKSIIDIKVQGKRKVWILTYGGIHLWNGKNLTSFPYKEFSILNLWGILPVNEDELWIYTSGGIFSLRVKDRIIKRHPVNQKIEGSKDLQNIVLSENGDVFILGKQLYLYKKNGILKKIKLSEWAKQFTIYNVLEDGDKIWLVTDGGLVSYDGEQWEQFPLKGIKVFDLVKVKEGEFWLGCSSGIGRFAGKEYEFFGYHDGVAVEESNTNAILCDQKGRVWIGGKNITLVYPFLIQKPSPPKPLITKVVAGKRVYTLPESIELSPKISTIEIFFSSPSYFNEQGQVFRYRLRNIEKEWSETKEEHSVRYANLPPGDLIYEVQSRQRHGDWSGSISRLGIKMLPTFWQTNWAKAIIVLILVTIGFIISFVWVMYLKSQKLKLQRLVKKQTRKIRNQRDMLAKLASVDELTQLANRRKFFETMEIDMLKARRYNRPLSLCIFDIDDFKDINDRYGHYMGDKVLKYVAERGKESIRATDLLGRWGGDEFILLMPETNKSRAIKICQRLKNNINSSPAILSDEATITFTITGGISAWDPDKTEYKNSEDFFKEADIALYQGKESGKNTISVYENHQKKDA
ncbi:MAG: diguanylate cyclase [Candidatus Aminicenantaceae bacterium]